MSKIEDKLKAPCSETFENPLFVKSLLTITLQLNKWILRNSLIFAQLETSMANERTKLDLKKLEICETKRNKIQNETKNTIQCKYLIKRLMCSLLLFNVVQLLCVQ